MPPTGRWTIPTATAALWAIEQEVRGHDPDTRRAARQRSAAPIVAELFERWEAELRRLPGKGKLAEAIRYALRRRDDLERFLDDGRIEIDTNIVERFFSKLKHFQGVTTRYEKHDANYLALVKLATSRIWIRIYESVT